MTAKLVTHAMRAAVLFLTIVCAYGQTRSNSTDLNALIEEGKASLAQKFWKPRALAENRGRRRAWLWQMPTARLQRNSRTTKTGRKAVLHACGRMPWSAGLRATSPLGPFLWMEWQAAQLTWFLA